MGVSSDVSSHPPAAEALTDLPIPGLRTGHFRLSSHLQRLRISHTDECPCGTSVTQNPRTHPPALMPSPRQPTKLDLVGGSGDAGGEALEMPPGPGEDCGLHHGRPDYRFDCTTDDLNAEEEEEEDLIHYQIKVHSLYFLSVSINTPFWQS